MNQRRHKKGEVSYRPCPPQEFAGRFDQRKRLLEILLKVKGQGVKDLGHLVMISGARGSGKSSFLDWAEYEIQIRREGLNSPAIKKNFLETPGMIFTTYRDLLTELKGHQKFGWFRKALDNPNVKKSIEVGLGVFESASSLAGPGKVAVDSGIAAARGLLPGETVEYSKLLTSFLKILRSLSGELIKNEQFLVILCDDAQWSSQPDFQLLKDLIRNLPPGIAFIITFRLETQSMEKYAELRQELDRYGHTEICLSRMGAKGIKDFAMRRYNLAINDATAEFLSKKIGDPLCLVCCFNLLQTGNLEPNLPNFQKILPEALKPAQCIYSGLDEKWKDRVDSLCILHPPLPLLLIACILRIEGRDMARLKDELNQSIVFKRLGKETYDFAHPSLREYCKKELPEDVAISFHSQAADCFEALSDRFPDKWFVALSLAEHLFFGQKYEKALVLNLLIGDQLYDRFDFHLALELMERAEICAEKTKSMKILSTSLHQKGMILQSMFRFDDALNAYNQSLKIKQQGDNRAGEAKTLHQIAMVYEDTNRYEQALKYYRQSLEIAREIGDRVMEAKTLHQIGMVYQHTNRYEEALEYYTQSLKIAQEIGDRAGEASSLYQMGRVYQLTNRYKEALEYCNQSLEIARDIGHRDGEAKNLHQIGMVYEDTKRYKEALEYYTQSLKIVREIGDRAGEPMTLHQIGVVYYLTKSYEEALEYYNQSLEIEREIGDRAGEAKTLHQFGMVYQDTKRYEEALEYYNQSLEILGEIGNNDGEEVTLQEI